jgi:peptidoglycan/xylan/chitin deacetylase (PgdA/CDA1 family)
MGKYLIRRAASGLIGAAFLALALNQGRHGLLSPFIFYFLLSGFPILLPTLWRNCGWLGPVRQRFLTAQNEVWLTLDDGPNPHETPEILDVLSEHQAKATFFVVGKNVARWPHLARMIVEQGHSIQNHTFHHRSATFWAATPAVVRREITLCNEAIFAATGTTPTQFRAPVGMANHFVHTEVEKAGLELIGWSASGNDGVAHKPAKVLKKILGRVNSGAIVLLHEGPMPGLAVGERARTLRALLVALELRGFRTVVPMTGNHTHS